MHSEGFENKTPEALWFEPDSFRWVCGKYFTTKLKIQEITIYIVTSKSDIQEKER